MDMIEVSKIWKKVKEELSVKLPEHVFGTWVLPIDAVDFENNTLVLLSPHPMAVDILKKSWLPQIREIVRSVLGPDANFSLNYDRDVAKNYITKKKKELKSQISGQTEQEKEEIKTRQSLAQMQSSANLNLNLKFENFVVGDNSKFAYNAAFSVANSPSKKFNPLFIYGASGLGKTHLLQAIGHYIVFHKPELKVKYIRMEEYFNEWIKCFQHGDTQPKKGCNNSMMRKFHQRFQNIDVLLMDDIQFIEGRMKTMEEFFSTFEALYTNNKQIVIASDRLPSDIPKLDTRLRTRFEMGLVVDIVPPDLNTRIEIVKAYSQEFGNNNIDENVFKFIADNFVSNVRELKGAFNKVSAFSEFLGEPLTIETAKKALAGELSKNSLEIKDIAQAVSSFYGLTIEDLKSSARQHKISSARHIAIYLSREILNLSFESIGKYFEKKHTTIMYSCDLVTDKLKTASAGLQEDIDSIKSMIRG